MAKKLSKKNVNSLNREITDKISEMMDDNNNRCTNGDDIDTTMGADIADAIDPEAEKSRNDGKACWKKMGVKYL